MQKAEGKKTTTVTPLFTSWPAGPVHIPEIRTSYIRKLEIRLGNRTTSRYDALVLDQYYECVFGRYQGKRQELQKKNDITV